MSETQRTFETRILSSLVKVFADEPLQAPETTSGTALLGEVVSFQIAYRSSHLIQGMVVRSEGDLLDITTIRSVGLVPCEVPWRESHDDNVLRTTPGLYPDPLFPITDAGITALPEQWRSVWVTVTIPESGEPGRYSVGVVFEDANGDRLGSAEFELEILPVVLPRQRLICTQWFHSDCIASHYGVDAWSEEHWLLVERFIDDAVRHGVNMILTPIFTPPLDTEVGGERPTMQLVDVTLDHGEYLFGFDRLERWVRMGDRLGVEYFEFAHLFTQWGARHCPKIVARVGEADEKIFGWHTRADSAEYKRFLDSFLPALVAFIDAHGLRDRCYFHVSDEPRLVDLESYTTAARLVRRHLADFPIMDALSDYEIYKSGAVGIPVPASNHIEPFIENEVRPLWTYYCVSQREAVANRFFAMPSERNRVLGLQLFIFKASGFLHWGYNFWYSQYSRRQIDPFTTTDAGHAFPSGDAFLVYPGPAHPIDSLRFEVFREALQDVRALSLLADTIGHDAVVALLNEGLPEPISFSSYPHSSEWLLAKRSAVNRRLAELAPTKES